MSQNPTRSISPCAAPISNNVEGGTPQGDDGANSTAPASVTRAASIWANRPAHGMAHQDGRRVQTRDQFSRSAA